MSLAQACCFLNMPIYTYQFITCLSLSLDLAAILLCCSHAHHLSCFHPFLMLILHVNLLCSFLNNPCCFLMLFLLILSCRPHSHLCSLRLSAPCSLRLLFLPHLILSASHLLCITSLFRTFPQVGSETGRHSCRGASSTE